MAEAEVRSTRLALPDELRRTVRYGIVGVSAITVDFAIYSLLVMAGVWYPVAKALSLVVATAAAYVLHRGWTFRAGAHRGVLLARYLTIQGASVAANIALLALLVEGAGVNAIAAQAIVVPFIAVASFLGQRFWTFGATAR